MFGQSILARFIHAAVVLGFLAIYAGCGASGDPAARQGVIDAFHQAYYETEVFNDTYWMGVAVQKTPNDLWTFQEIINDVQPDVLIEAGTYMGGSAYYFASLMDLMDHGQVVTVDIVEQESWIEHPRIHYIVGSSTSSEVLEQVKGFINEGDTVMVTLDSDHSRDPVLDELRLYSELVTPGSYLVVEDTQFNGHPVQPNWGPGPMEALEAFLAENDGFEVDAARQKFLFTFNPSGYLRKRH